MKPIHLLVMALSATSGASMAEGLAALPFAPVPVATAASEAEIYIVTSRDTFAGISAITSHASPVHSRAGTALVLARTDAEGVEAIAHYVHQQEGRCGGFFAFSSRAEAEAFLADDRSAEAIAQPMDGTYTIDNQATVIPWLPQVDQDNIRATIDSLSNGFQNRWYGGSLGRDAALWIRDRWQSLANGRRDVQVRLHEECGNCGNQPSVILRLQGSDLADEVVVVGAHLDSINGGGSAGVNQIAPGADDDASGVASVTEIIRIALESNWKPRRTVEFHAYAAEEIGLRGSNAIASAYANSGVNVVGMLQLDMTNYRTTAPYHIRIVGDNANQDLLTFFRELFDTYLQPLGLIRGALNCGYGCSDHASWHARGYPAGMLFEAGRQLQPGDNWGDFPYIHTANDTLANMGNSAQHSVPFAQFGLAFIGELGKTTLSGPLDPELFADSFEQPSAGSLQHE